MTAQLENGFTRIANEIIEKLCALKLNGTQFSILLFIMRFTFGFQREFHELSLNFIAKGICTHKDQVKRELDKLIEWNIVTVNQIPTFKKTRGIGINMNTDDWKLHVSGKDMQSTNPSTGGELVEKQSAKKPTPTVDGLAHQRKKDLKDIKEIYNAQFEVFWSLYPSKKGRASALSKWLSIAPGMNFERVMDGTRAYIEFCKATDRPHKDGCTFVNQASWEDDWSMEQKPNTVPRAGYSTSKRPTPKNESPYEYPEFLIGERGSFENS